MIKISRREFTRLAIGAALSVGLGEKALAQAHERTTKAGKLKAARVIAARRERDLVCGILVVTLPPEVFDDEVTLCRMKRLVERVQEDLGRDGTPAIIFPAYCEWKLLEAHTPGR